MIRTISITTENQLIHNQTLEELQTKDLAWFWVDFSIPSEEESNLLESFFHFHPLAIEDTVMSLNRPKLDYYADFSFLILNALDEVSLDALEVALFVGENYIVSYHTAYLKEIDEAWERVSLNKDLEDKGPSYVAYQILDKIVDQFFPAVYKLEDDIDILEDNESKHSIHVLINKVFEVRGDLIKLRRIVNSMRDLLYRILNSDRLQGFKEHRLYFSDIHDHLLKLSEMVESNSHITSDMRDSYLSLSSNRMNTNMMILTVITTIFIPLTFIAGVYGMNFTYMPELDLKYGYFMVLIIMVVIAVLMFLWFKKKGWFDI